MAQLNVYVPDDLEAEIKEAAKKRSLSISAFITEAVKEKLHPGELGWSSEFVNLLQAAEGGFPEEIPDLPLQKRDEENTTPKKKKKS